MKVYYYCHLFSDPHAEIRDANLRRAMSRVMALGKAEYGAGRVVWAPWIALAAAGIAEERAWRIIAVCIANSDGIIVDYDGKPASPGMLREMELARGLDVVEVDKPGEARRKQT